MDGRTLIRIFRDKEGKLAYNLFLDGTQDIGWELLGAIEIAKREVLNLFESGKDVPKDESEKARKLLDNE